MQSRKMMAALTLLATASLLLVLIASSAAQGQQKKDKLENVNLGNIDTMYHAVVVTGMNNESLTFNVLNTVIKGKDGSVLIKELTSPMPVQYYYSNNTIIHGVKNKSAYEELQGFTRTNYDSATINVAGASAVVAAKNITVRKLDNSAELQVTGFSVYRPDGTAKSYKLDTPVKAVMSPDSKTMTATGNPQFRAALQDALKGGAKFPANAAPIKIKDIDAKIK